MSRCGASISVGVSDVVVNHYYWWEVLVRGYDPRLHPSLKPPLSSPPFILLLCFRKMFSLQSVNKDFDEEIRSQCICDSDLISPALPLDVFTYVFIATCSAFCNLNCGNIHSCWLHVVRPNACHQFILIVVTFGKTLKVTRFLYKVVRVPCRRLSRVLHNWCDTAWSRVGGRWHSRRQTLQDHKRSHAGDNVLLQAAGP